MSRATRVCPPGATAAIFVEEGDDERMVKRLLGGPPVFYQCFDGRDLGRLANRAMAARNDPGWYQIRPLGVLLDAEEDPSASWRLLCHVSSSLGLPVPANPAQVESVEGYCIGGFLVPGEGRSGGSESLLLRTASEAELRCIDAFFICTPNPGSTVAQPDKARAQVLAAAVAPGGRVDQLWDRVDPMQGSLGNLRNFLIALTTP